MGDASGSSEKPSIRRKVSLKAWNTLGVEATAQTLYQITRKEQIDELYSCHRISGNLLVLGGGSNVLLKDPLPDPVVKMEISSLDVVHESDQEVHLQAGAGVVWHELVRWAVERDLGGLEQLALIPGTVGAAPVQNIGAYGVELADRMVSLEAFDLTTGKWQIMEPGMCDFGYRESLFKGRERGRYVIGSVTFRLIRSGYTPSSDYRALSEWLEKQEVREPTIRNVFDAVVAIRQSKLPDPTVIGNAGSFFKNPVISVGQLETIRSRFADVPFYPVNAELVKVPAAWLIENAGMKGIREGNVGTWPEQPLVLINYGDAGAEEILTFSDRIRRRILEMFGIDLEREVTLISANDS
ncbi:MAG: UDP-N-acetylmuramate dehydrogenase [Balneolaceae bacterium]